MKKAGLVLLIITAVFYQTSYSQKQVKELTLEDIWLKPTFSSARFSNPESMNNGEDFTLLEFKDSYGEIAKYNYKTYNKTGVILKGDEIKYKDKSVRIEGYSFSADEQQVLIQSNVEGIYRHSTREDVFVIDLKSKKVTPVFPDTKIMYASFSPDGKKVAYVYDNNLFVRDMVSGSVSQITNDGKYNEIINGATDWVYEEEFSMSRGYEWSPNGNYIAFYRFNEKNVKQFSMTMFESKLYPEEYRFKYPKAGEENSEVQIYVYDLAGKSVKKVDVNSTKEDYIPRIKWTANPSVLSVTKLNRMQNKLELYLAKVEVEKITTAVLLKEEASSYIEIGDDLTFLSNGKQFIWSSEKDGYQHLYLYNMDGTLANQITKGNFEVKNFMGCDEKKGLIYYVSAESNPSQRDLYVIGLKGDAKKKLSENAGTNTAFFSTTFKYYINFFSNANTPNIITLHSSDGKKIKVLEENKKLNDKLKEYELSKKEFFSFKTSQNIELNGWMIKPNNFDPSKKYPVYMFVYGGPGANTVNDRWEGANYMWYLYLAQKGYMVVSVDNRGTGCRGRDFRSVTYKDLGKIETEDQIEAAKYLGSLSYVDKNRIGIQGWSYGGYMSSLCITKGAEFFRIGIAVAPVTNWRYYDSIYTERYNGLPQDNAKGYDENSPVNHVDKLKGKYLLIHGTADDNVHFQNAVEMTTALVKAGKQFDSFYYPDKNHGIYGGNTRLHIYTLITNYVFNNL